MFNHEKVVGSKGQSEDDCSAWRKIGRLWYLNSILAVLEVSWAVELKKIDWDKLPR